MKNLLIALLIPFIFIIASAFAFDDGGTDVEIIFAKTSLNAVSITIPDKFIGKDGQLLLPFVIELTPNGKMPHTMSSQELVITLPDLNYSGKVMLVLSIGSYNYSREIVL